MLGVPGSVESSPGTPGRLPWPRVLLIETNNSGIFLIRLDGNASFGGDTWHASVEDAKAQAIAEYGGLLSEWRSVPDTVPTDDKAVVAFALEQ